MSYSTAEPRPDPLDAVLTGLARCEDPIVARWAEALLRDGEAGSDDHGAHERPVAAVGTET